MLRHPQQLSLRFVLLFGVEEMAQGTQSVKTGRTQAWACTGLHAEVPGHEVTSVTSHTLWFMPVALGLTASWPRVSVAETSPCDVDGFWFQHVTLFRGLTKIRFILPWGH